MSDERRRKAERAAAADFWDSEAQERAEIERQRAGLTRYLPVLATDHARWITRVIPWWLAFLGRTFTVEYQTRGVSAYASVMRQLQALDQLQEEHTASRGLSWRTHLNTMREELIAREVRMVQLDVPSLLIRAV